MIEDEGVNDDVGNKATKQNQQTVAITKPVDTVSKLGKLQQHEVKYTIDMKSEYEHLFSIIHENVIQKISGVSMIKSESEVIFKGEGSYNLADRRIWILLSNEQHVEKIKELFHQDGMTFDCKYENKNWWWSIAYPIESTIDKL